jgi:uncharacterized protein (DUF1501 family)
LPAICFGVARVSASEGWERHLRGLVRELVAAVTEFGRSAGINGTEGTNHGTATVRLANRARVL